MGLTSGLSVAAAGLRATQAAVDVTARNIANVDTPGYTRKTINQRALIAGEQNIGVLADGLSRATSTLVQRELRGELSSFGNLTTLNEFYVRIDEMFGAPGAANSLDGIYNSFTQSLEELVTSPESVSARSQVIASANILAQRINGLGDQIQGMRLEAERQLDESVDDVNTLLESLATVNRQIVAFSVDGNPPVDIIDQRDQIIDELSQFFDIRVIDRADNSVSVVTTGGTVLFDNEPVQLSFDARSTVNAGTLYSTDPSERALGTISLVTPGGFTIDLIADGALRGGSIGALVELRDDILVEAQTQLDEFASNLARSLSDRPIASTTAPLGADNAEGLDLDLSAVQPGDSFTFTYSTNPGGAQAPITFIRVDDPSTLPLDNSVTPRSDDVVVGIDFSGGFAAAIAAIDAALPTDFDVSLDGASTLRIRDDGVTANTLDVDGLSAVVTPTAVTDQGVGVPLFVDGSIGSQPFTGSLDGQPQIIGFSSRIAVNPDIEANPDALVIYETGANPTEPGDYTRPQAILDRLNTTDRVFSAATGINGDSTYTDSVSGFLQQLISFQTANAANVDRQETAQRQTVQTLQDRYFQDTAVDVDREMARLVELQNVYAANARVISVIQDMVNALLAI